MPEKICIVYNEPDQGRCSAAGEHGAIAGVLLAVDSVFEALECSGRVVSRVAVQPPVSHIAEAIRRRHPDLVFNLFEGFDGDPGSEGDMARLLEALGLRYTGAPAQALQQCCDKQVVKAILRRHGLPTADWVVLKPEDCANPESFPLSFPCFVKPVCADASHGISESSVVADLPKLQRQVARLHATYGQPALVEEFLPGREFNVLVMAPPLKVFPVSEIIYRLPPEVPRILTYGSKWDASDPAYRATEPGCPADIDAGLRQELQEIAVRSFGLLVGSGYARVDMRINGSGRVMVMDVNPNPDIGPGSGARLQAEKNGLTCRSFIDLIIGAAADGADAIVGQAGADMRAGARPRAALRPMRPGDKVPVMGLLHVTPEFKLAEVAVAEEVLDSYLAGGSDSGYSVYVAESAGALAGYLCFGETPLTEGTWDMYWIAVAPACKGRGVGTQMVRFAERAIRRRRGRMILVETSSSAAYASARRFYEQLGYCRISDTPDFYAPGDGRILYQKLLHTARGAPDVQNTASI